MLTGFHVVSGANELPLPDVILQNYFRPPYGVTPITSLPDSWIQDLGTQVLGGVVIDALPAGPLTVEVSERTEQSWQATLPVTVN